MSILITGFAPFDGAEVNPSWEAVRLVPDQLQGHAVHKLLLPVVYGEAARLVTQEIRRRRPTLVICCGLAGGRTALTPELVAVNYRFARIADNAGQMYYGEKINPDGPDAFMTRLPVHAMITAMQSAGLPAALSLSAGAYVCNDVYYELLSSEADLGHRGLFLHVPGMEVMSAEDAARGIALCAQTALA
ncbi:MAG: pyroglutamyl-peptidase I [Clostridia bacterium]|nr:pyroglutamyl-peptidase I [Clostridia bacterium]